MGFEPTTSCIRGKRLTARPRDPYGILASLFSTVFSNAGDNLTSVEYEYYILYYVLKLQFRQKN